MKSRNVVLLDYGIGNVLSVARAIEHVDGNVILSNQLSDIKKADRLILPGVGAFGDCKAALEKQGLVEPILDFVKTGRPFFGICVGMQLILSKSLEFGTHFGFDLISGQVERISSSAEDIKQEFKVPHIGWSQLIANGTCDDGRWYKAAFKDVHEPWYYFVHSYSANPVDQKHIAAYVEYHGMRITAAIAKENIFGTQFHPEKSGADGLALLKNFLDN